MSSSSRGKPEADEPPEVRVERAADGPKGREEAKPAKPASPGRYSLSAEHSTEAVGVRIERVASVRPPSNPQDAPPAASSPSATMRRQTMQMTSDAPPSPSSPPTGAAALAAAQAAPETVRGPGPLPTRSQVSTSTQRMEVQQPPPQQAVPTKTVRMQAPPLPRTPPGMPKAPPPLPTGKDPSSARMKVAPPVPAPNPKATTVAQPIVGPKPSPLASSLPPAASPEANADAFAPTPLAPVVITPVIAPEPAKRPATEPPKRPSYRPPGIAASGFPGFDEGSIAFAFDALMSETPTGVGQLQNVDLTPVRELFAQLAASHMRHVRDFMLDVKWGEATREWVEICVPACVSLRRASERLELGELTTGLDAFADALKAVPPECVVIDGDAKQRLLDTYGKLADALPTAFSLDNDKSEREAVIVQALLLQIPDVRKVTIDKLHAAGLTSLKTLWEATPKEIAQVSGIPESLAERIIQRFQEYRRELRESRPSDARAAEREKLAALAKQLEEQHDGYEEASRGWSSEAKAKKRELIRAREETWLAISLLLARFGEVERLQGIEKVPFAQRIAQLEGWLEEAAEKYRLDP